MTIAREYLTYFRERVSLAVKHFGQLGAPALRILYIAYPLFVITGALILLPRASHAGQIRKLNLSPEKPGVINLAYGNATAVSFQSKPEKLVPGSPQKVEINFLGKDITISPLGPAPGNLIVYTNGTRYVLLFKIVPESMHDDVVEVISAQTSKARPIRLLEDSYTVKRVSVALMAKSWREPTKNVDFEVVAYRDRLISDDLVDFLAFQKGVQCDRCVLRKRTAEKSVTCTSPLTLPIKCRSEQFTELTIRGTTQ